MSIKGEEAIGYVRVSTLRQVEEGTVFKVKLMTLGTMLIHVD